MPAPPNKQPLRFPTQEEKDDNIKQLTNCLPSSKSLKGGLNPYLKGGHSGEITPMGGSKAYVVTSDVHQPSQDSPIWAYPFWY